MQDDAETTKQKYNVQAAEVKVWPWLDAVTSHFTGKKASFEIDRHLKVDVHSEKNIYIHIYYYILYIYNYANNI